MYTSKSLLNNIWKLKDFDDRQSLMLSQRYNISPLIGKLLNIRNITEDKIEQFLNPEIFNFLPNPFEIKDMDKSIKRISKSIIKNKLIGIIADYDVDGSTSAAIICKFFKSINQNYILKIPNRLKDGYGPNKKILNELINDKIDLLLTLDCGTTSFDIFDKSSSFLFDTIVIDHHISEKIFPNVFSIINPNRYDDNNTYKDLAAVGVAFLFIIALRKELRNINFFKNNNIREPNILKYLDLVALGTICDVVSLQDYNRVLVSKGVEIIHKRINKGLTAIIDNSKISHSPTVSDLGFIIGPQLNAASRIDDSSLSSKILISENMVEIESISRKLFILNEKRKLIEKELYNSAYEQALKQKNQNVLIVYGENWHKGVLGIVASKLVENFNKPSIVISFNNEIGIGSSRSLYSIDLGHIILDAKKNKLLIKGGGHKMAAGFQIEKNKLEEFSKYIVNFFSKYEDSFFQKILFFDSTIILEEINFGFLNDIEKLEPFGNKNPEPKFIVKNVIIDFAKVINNKHILINLKNNKNALIKGISFNSFDNSLGQNLLNNKSKKFDIACSIKKDIYQGNSQLQLIIHDAILIN